MADASDSKSDEGDFVWVQVPSPAYKKGFIPKGMEPFFEAERAMNPRVHLRSASVRAKRSSPGRAAPHLLRNCLMIYMWLSVIVEITTEF